MATMDVLQRQPVLEIVERSGYLSLDRHAAAAAGAALHDRYVAAEPFPHIALEDFIDRSLLNRVNDEFPRWEPGRFADAQSNRKTGYQLEKIDSPFVNALLNALNGPGFLAFLESMTGIDGLVPDPWQVGGGLHETRRGGHLSIHADFNMHPKLGLRRRLNLILFLNEDWDDSYGGHLELWARDMSACRAKVAPRIGTAVIFNTDSDSFHGHPDPLACPEDRTRRSIALYYYAADPELTSTQMSRTTDFRVRPGSHDKVDVKNRARHLIKDLCPPILWRQFNR
ncbi:MAG: 2OG-Fe(II) oxygenase [Sphingomonadaceae bacterium]